VQQHRRAADHHPAAAGCQRGRPGVVDDVEHAARRRRGARGGPLRRRAAC
jgi:hypothetical protein